FFFFFQAEDGIRDRNVTGVQTCALPISIPDHFLNIPAVATVSYRLSARLAAEGEFTWMIPVTQSVDLGSGTSQDRKSPDVLAYRSEERRVGKECRGRRGGDREKKREHER